MKKFFYFSLSIAILCACVSCCFLLWKREQGKKEKIAVLKEKRIRLDEYYDIEFRAAYFWILDKEKPMQYRMDGREWVEKTEADMLQDGYDRAEIDSMKMRCREEAADRLMRQGKTVNFK